MKIIDKYSKINMEEKVSNTLNLSKNKSFILFAVCLVLVFPYGLKAGVTGITNIKNSIEEHRLNSQKEAEEQKKNEIEGIINSGENKYRAYIDGDTERYLDFVKDYKLSNLSLKIYLNRKDNDVVCHFVDSNLNTDFIIAYNPERKIGGNLSLDFIEEGKVNYSLYDYTNSVLISLVETPTGYEKNLEILDLSNYVPEIYSDNVKIDYSTMNDTINTNILIDDDYLKNVYEEGNKKYLPLLKESNGSFALLSQSRLLHKINNISLNTQTFTHNGNVINYIQVTLSDGTIQDYLIAYDGVSDRDSDVGIDKSVDKDFFEIKDKIAKVEIKVSLLDGTVYFDYLNQE